MPISPPKPCSYIGCTNYSIERGRCPEHKKQAWHSTSRHSRGYGSQWDKQRRRALTRDGHLCQDCLDEGIYTAAKIVDHVKPKSQGGTDELINLRSLCKKHSDAKTNKESQQGRKDRFDTERLNK